MSARANSNPGTMPFFGVFVEFTISVVPVAAFFTITVEKSCILPAARVTGAEKSWYPSCFRSSVWVPAERPEMVAGKRPA